MTALRRRDQLVPLEAPDEDSASDYSSVNKQGEIFLEGSLEVPSEPAFDHYVTPCEYRVSNDPLVVTEEDVCDATIYGCARDHKFLISEDENVVEMDLQYDYDVYYRFDSSMHNHNSMVDFLEGTMLEHLASLLDIKQCPPGGNSSATSRGSGKRELSIQRGRKLMEFTEEQTAVFIAINSDPVDDRSQEDCVMPPEYGTACQAMVGYMKIYLERARVTDAEAVAISDAVLIAIENGMQSNVYAKGAIKNLVYVGDRTPPPPPSQPESLPPLLPSPPPPVVTVPVPASKEEPLPSSLASGKRGLGNTEIGLIAGASALAFLAALLALCFCMRRRNKESTTNESIPKEKLGDEEDGAMDSSSKAGHRGRNSHKKVAPAIVLQKSLEGAEIPGSLAAMDELALKPQIRRDEDDVKMYADSNDGSVPLTPPRVNRTVQTSSSCSTPNSGGRDSSGDGSVDYPLPMFPTLSPVPLSPVRNQKTGYSPSRVSPKRLPPHCKRSSDDTQMYASTADL